MDTFQQESGHLLIFWLYLDKSKCFAAYHWFQPISSKLNNINIQITYQTVYLLSLFLAKSNVQKTCEEVSHPFRYGLDYAKCS